MCIHQPYNLVTILLYLYSTITVSRKRNILLKGKKMKISKLLKKVVKEEGSHSRNSKAIVKLKNSKEFSYLIDTQR